MALEQIDQSLRMSPSSRLAGLVSEMRQLPESVLLKKLEIDAEAKRLWFDHENRKIDVMRADRADLRAVKTTRLQDSRKQEQRTEFLGYTLLAAVTLVLLGIVVGLYATDQPQVATPILTLLAGIVTGWVGGRGAGLAKAQREQKMREQNQDNTTSAS